MTIPWIETSCPPKLLVPRAPMGISSSREGLHLSVPPRAGPFFLLKPLLILILIPKPSSTLIVQMLAYFSAGGGRAWPPDSCLTHPYSHRDWRNPAKRHRMPKLLRARALRGGIAESPGVRERSMSVCRCLLLHDVR